MDSEMPKGNDNGPSGSASSVNKEFPEQSENGRKTRRSSIENRDDKGSSLKKRKNNDGTAASADPKASEKDDDNSLLEDDNFADGLCINESERSADDEASDIMTDDMSEDDVKSDKVYLSVKSLPSLTDLVPRTPKGDEAPVMDDNRPESSERPRQFDIIRDASRPPSPINEIYGDDSNEIKNILAVQETVGENEANNASRPPSPTNEAYVIDEDSQDVKNILAVKESAEKTAAKEADVKMQKAIKNMGKKRNFGASSSKFVDEGIEDIADIELPKSPPPK